MKTFKNGQHLVVISKEKIYRWPIDTQCLASLVFEGNNSNHIETQHHTHQNGKIKIKLKQKRKGYGQLGLAYIANEDIKWYSYFVRELAIS